MGVTGEAVAKARWYLGEWGIDGEQREQVMGAMIRIVHAMKSAGDDFELGSRMQTTLAVRRSWL